MPSGLPQPMASYNQVDLFARGSEWVVCGKCGGGGSGGGGSFRCFAGVLPWWDHQLGSGRAFVDLLLLLGRSTMIFYFTH